MKKYIILAALLTLAACSEAPEVDKVMARHVPERADDFVFENNLICGRIYGQALEAETTSPGIDIWVKKPGALVADQRYRDELENGKTYHKDWGNGKDCYKVGVSLGGGASAVVIENRLQYPATNYRSWEILEQTPDKVVFRLDYPEWNAGGESISLRKTFTVRADTYFVKVEDVYTFSGEFGDELEVVAGVFRHPEQETVRFELEAEDRYALWERASDQSVEPEDGMIGVAVYVPGGRNGRLSHGDDHGITGRRIKSGETFTYYFGSCWSKGEIQSWSDWLMMVDNLSY